MDGTLVKDDHPAFAALLANDLVINNLQNGISINGMTGNRNTAGLISYSSYVRSIEYAEMRGEMVLLMGDERVVPKGDSPMAEREVRRRSELTLTLSDWERIANNPYGIHRYRSLGSHFRDCLTRSALSDRFG